MATLALHSVALRFNLLPHRQSARQQARRRLGRQMAAVAALAVLVAALGYLLLSLRLDYVAAFNQTLDAAIAELAPVYRMATQLQQRHAALLQQQQQIAALDSRRAASVLLLADVADALPREVYLLRLETSGEKFSVSGRAMDALPVTRFFERLSESPRLSDLVLDEVRRPEGVEASGAPYQFGISGRLTFTEPTAPPKSPGLPASPNEAQP